MAFLKASVRFWALVAAAYFLLALGLIGTGHWGNWVSIAWLAPGANLLSWPFVCFSIVCLTFVYAGIAVGKNGSVGMLTCSAGFVMALLGFRGFGSGTATSEEVAAGLVFFIVPALIYGSVAFSSRKGRLSKLSPL